MTRRPSRCGLDLCQPDPGRTWPGRLATKLSDILWLADFAPKFRGSSCISTGFLLQCTAGQPSRPSDSPGMSRSATGTRPRSQHRSSGRTTARARWRQVRASQESCPYNRHASPTRHQTRAHFRDRTRLQLCSANIQQTPGARVDQRPLRPWPRHSRGRVWPDIPTLRAAWCGI